MARGRMLNKSISQDKAVAQLVNELGGYAGLVFTWMIAHLDREGRIHGDPDIIKGLAFPRIAGIDPAIIRQTAARACELGLIDWYQCNGDLFISYPKFESNQTGMRKDREPKSEYPSPTCDCSVKVSGNLTESIRQPSGNLPSEGNRIEEKVTRSKSTPLSTSPQGVKVDHDRSKEILAVFAHYRTKHPRMFLKPSSKSVEWRAVRDRMVVDGCTVEDLCKAIDGMHMTPHNLGDNPQGVKYLGIGICMRNGDQVNRFRETAEHGPPTKQRRLTAGEEAMAADIAFTRAHNAKCRAEAERNTGVVFDAPDGLVPSPPEHGAEAGNVAVLVAIPARPTRAGDSGGLRQGTEGEHATAVGAIGGNRAPDCRARGEAAGGIAARDTA